MVDFHNPKLEKTLQAKLLPLEIEYVFQPIFLKDGESVFAYEALMRPKGKTIGQLIEEYQEQNELHVLEIATFIGAMQSYAKRGYKEHISINSFPTETLSKKECDVLNEMFPEFKEKSIIEILEYPEHSMQHIHKKCDGFESQEDLTLAIDDFGSGNHMSMTCIDYYKPHIVKIDQEMVKGIHSNVKNQKEIAHLIKECHKRNILVVAEGIETKEEFEYLSKIGIDLFQGFYLGRPK